MLLISFKRVFVKVFYRIAQVEHEPVFGGGRMDYGMPQIRCALRAARPGLRDGKLAAKFLVALPGVVALTDSRSTTG